MTTENLPAPNAHKSGARVAFVFSEYKVAINKGADDGIEIGRTFLIYALGDEIKDPITGESLGQIELVRGRGKVVYLQEHMAHVQSMETHTSKTRRANNFSAFLDNLSEVIENAPFVRVSVGDICRPI